MKPGQQLQSGTCSTRVVIVRVPDPSVVVECAGRAMVESGPRGGGAPGGGASGPAPTGPGTALGKRYVDEGSGLELLCVAAGEGDLSCDGRPMLLQGAKPLPSSD